MSGDELLDDVLDRLSEVEGLAPIARRLIESCRVDHPAGIRNDNKWRQLWFILQQQSYLPFTRSDLEFIKDRMEEERLSARYQ